MWVSGGRQVTSCLCLLPATGVVIPSHASPGRCGRACPQLGPSQQLTGKRHGHTGKGTVVMCPVGSVGAGPLSKALYPCRVSVLIWLLLWEPCLEQEYRLLIFRTISVRFKIKLGYASLLLNMKPNQVRSNSQGQGRAE